MSLKIFLILCSLYTFALSGCAFLGKSTPPPDCDPQLDSLMLTDADFPPGWSSGNPNVDDEYREGAYDSCLKSYYVYDGSAGQVIAVYQNEEQATKGYLGFYDWLAWEEVTRTLTAPVYISPFADRYYLACAIDIDTPMCRVIAKYGSYVVLFNTHYDPKFMTSIDLENILRSIDNKMSEKINP